MILVIDANIVMAALLKDSRARAIIVGGVVKLVSPDYIMSEISEHARYIIRKAGIQKEGLDLLVALLFRNIEIIPYSEYKHRVREAKEIMKVDLGDVPYVACYLALNCDGIWTNDRHYDDKSGLKIFDTAFMSGISQT